MITSNDLKNGMTIIHNSTVHEILDFQHIKPGKGHAFVRTKLKNLKNGTIFEHTFRAKEPLEQAIVDKTQLQYLYRDKNMFYFMDNETYEQTPVDERLILPYIDYLIEEQMVSFVFYDGEIIDVSFPEFINLRVTSAAPGAKGNTAQGATKPVTLETGKEIQAPLFINEGDLLRVDTRNGKYVERVKE